MDLLMLPIGMQRSSRRLGMYLAVCLATIPMAVFAQERVLSGLARGILGKDGGDKMFYFPTRSQPYTPDDYGLDFEDVYFNTGDGVKLHAWFLPSKMGVAKAKGTIVFSHGNAGAVGNHLGFTYWMMEAGYNVLMYDYRGYGKSEGKVTKKGLVQDVVAAFDYIKTREDIDTDRLISFGHSLGGAKSIAGLAQKAPVGVRAIVVDATFSSYGDMAERIGGATARAVVSSSYDPVDYIKRLPKVPLLIVHGEADGTIPFVQAEKLFGLANPPKKLMAIEGGDHVGSFAMKNIKYRQQLLQWLDNSMADKEIEK